MFVVVPSTNSTGLAIVVGANLRCGDYLSEKSCLKLVVSTSFWSWLLNVFSVLTSLKYTATFFGWLMRCGYADVSWEYKFFNFVLCISETCLFLRSALM